MFKLNLTEGQTLPQISLFKATVQNIGHYIYLCQTFSHSETESVDSVQSLCYMWWQEEE